MTPTDLLDAFFNGLSFSSILILAALGLGITFGVMRVINMAHGDMMMLGAYTAYVFTNPKVFQGLVHKIGGWVGLDIAIQLGIDFNLYWALPISFLVVGTVGYLLEVFLIRHLYNRPLDTLLATWGVGLVLQQSVILLLGPDLKPLDFPDEVNLTFYRLFLAGCIGLVLLSLYTWLVRGRLVERKVRLAGKLSLSSLWVNRLSWLLEIGVAVGVGYFLVTLLFGFPEIEYSRLVGSAAGLGIAPRTGALSSAINLQAGHILKVDSLPTLRGNFELQVGTISVALPYYRIFILGVTVICLVAVYLWFFKTSSGLKIRAVTQNRQMAAALGISTRRVDSLTFAFGSGLAGVAGCLLGHLYDVKADMGNSYIVEAFMVVILGGMGSLWGTIVAGVIIGTGKSILAKFLSTSAPEMIRQVDGPMAQVGVWMVVIAFIMFRPSGLFAARERVYD